MAILAFRGSSFAEQDGLWKHIVDASALIPKNLFSALAANLEPNLLNGDTESGRPGYAAQKGYEIAM